MQNLTAIQGDSASMAGGYENEDRMAELEELRREKEREARERLEKARRELMAPAGDVHHDGSGRMPGRRGKGGATEGATDEE